MEQQTVSVAKAGLVCRLRSRCSVVAAQNCRNSTSTGKARGHGVSYDPDASLAVNSGLPPPLLSRFDLVVVFADGSKGGASEQDKADFILGSSAAPKDGMEHADGSAEGGVDKISHWSHERLRDYVAWARDNALTEADDPGAAELLQTYFAKLRSQNAGVTVRTLESLVRLTQAHAKLMGHRAISIEDAVAVIILHKASLQGRVVGCEDGSSGDGSEDFPMSMRDLQDETPSCNVNVKLEGVDLHHGIDIANEEVYRLLQQHLLRSLGKHRRLGSRTLEDAPKPIQDRVVHRQTEKAAAPEAGRTEVQVGASQAVPQQKGWAAAALPATAAARAINSPRQPPSQGVATTVVKPRGARLGFRLR